MRVSQPPLVTPSLPSRSAPLSQAPGGSGVETITTFDNKGSPTTVTVPAGFATMPKSYDDQGFQIFPTATAAAASTPATSAAPSSPTGSAAPGDDVGSKGGGKSPWDALPNGGEGVAPDSRLLGSVGMGVSLVLAALYIVL